MGKKSTSHKKKNFITIRIVDSQEIKKLNFFYRNQKKPTNILSFPYNLYLNSNNILLGDLVICSKIIKKEAKKQKKNIKGHWAHIFIHGVLHLLGYNHIKKKETKKMELLECTILKKLGFKNPYISNMI
ncbi:rRNA maturation RNase YbeY [Buchnera aphidicola]|uniref:rRNA maturation RNase YbeY n=1 Tax=Buchnera aphidicola TaxID=9 RepID=UPI0034647925